MGDVGIQARSTEYSVTLLIAVSESHVELDVGECELGVDNRNAEIGTVLAVESGGCVDPFCQ
jgi:hypothetical protein